MSELCVGSLLVKVMFQLGLLVTDLANGLTPWSYFSPIKYCCKLRKTGPWHRHHPPYYYVMEGERGTPPERRKSRSNRIKPVVP